jgi:hypothetical protein
VNDGDAKQCLFFSVYNDRGEELAGSIMWLPDSFQDLNSYMTVQVSDNGGSKSSPLYYHSGTYSKPKKQVRGSPIIPEKINIIKAEFSKLLNL